jgi:hypothetical protein
MYNLPLKLKYFWQNKLREEEEVAVVAVVVAVGEVAVVLVVRLLE